MPFVPVPGVAEAALVFSQDGQTIVNVLHYEFGDVWTPTEMNELASLLVQWWSSDVRTLAAGTLTLQQIRVTSLEADNAPAINYSTGLPLAGSRTDEAMPNNVAICMTKRTILRGRSYRGRLYHPGATMDMISGNTVAPTHSANLVSAYNEAISLPGAANVYNLQVVSRYQDGDWLQTGIATSVTNFTTDGTVDSQRRRLPGRGR